MSCRSLVDGITVIGNVIWKEIPSFEEIEKIHFAVSTTTTFDPTTFQQVTLPNSCRNVDFYFDSSTRGIYINNFSIYQDLLNVKIEAIIFLLSKAHIYLGEKCLVIAKNQIRLQCQNEDFYIQFFESNSFIPPKKKRRAYVEGRRSELCSQSSELGVFTTTIFSQPSLDVMPTAETCTSSINLHTISSQVILSDSLLSNSSPFEPLSCRSEVSEENVEYEEEEVQEDEPIQEEGEVNEGLATETLHFVKKINQTKLDKKEIRKNYLDSIRTKLSSLMKAKQFKNPNYSLIPPTLLHVTKEVPENDEVVSNMKAELKKSPVVHDPDPILVVQRCGKYEVVSGNRRALAYKRSRVESIRVSTISESEKDHFILFKFFNSSSANDKDTSTMITTFTRLLQFLELTPEELRNWNAKEITSVFGEYIGKATKMKFVFDIVLEPNLRDEMLNLCLLGVQFPVQLCRTIIRKYHQNPKEVLSIIQNVNMTNTDHLKILANVKPDLQFLLREKGISEHVAEQFTQCFMADENFHRFVRGGDFRFVDKKNELTDLVERYKKFNSIHRDQNSKSSVRILTDDTLTDIDIAVTSDERIATSIIEKNNNVVVVLIGNLYQNVNQFILRIPDHLSQKNQSGKLQNVEALSILMKRNGEFLDQNDTLRELVNTGLRDRSLIEISDVKILSFTLKHVFLDFSEKITQELASEIIHEKSTAIVSNEVIRRKFEMYLRKKQHESEEEPQPDTEE